VLKARIRPEALFAYLGKVLFGSSEDYERLFVDCSLQIAVSPETMHLRPMPQAGIRSIMERISGTRPFIDPQDWARFLRTGEVNP
jgi:hypothetical protein